MCRECEVTLGPEAAEDRTLMCSQSAEAADWLVVSEAAGTGSIVCCWSAGAVMGEASEGVTVSTAEPWPPPEVEAAARERLVEAARLR